MVKKIIHVSDIHVRTLQRIDEYNELLDRFIEMCADIAKDYDKDEVRIVICGDTFHSKLNISNEQITLISEFIRKLERVARVIMISGNHDLVVENESRMDTMTALFKTSHFENTVFLDMELNYESGIYVDDNITWALYSIFDNFKKPNIEQANKDNPNNIIVGLYHGRIMGAKLQNGTDVDNGLECSFFEGCDVVMAGDIHKRQEIDSNGVRLVYSGSLIQQNIGETVTEHGFALWNMETMEYEFIDLESEYSLYKMNIDSIEDIDEDKEKITNYK